MMFTALALLAAQAQADPWCVGDQYLETCVDSTDEVWELPADSLYNRRRARHVVPGSQLPLQPQPQPVQAAYSTLGQLFDHVDWMADTLDVVRQIPLTDSTERTICIDQQVSEIAQLMDSATLSAQAVAELQDQSSREAARLRRRVQAASDQVLLATSRASHCDNAR